GLGRGRLQPGAGRGHGRAARCRWWQWLRGAPAGSRWPAPRGNRSCEPPRDRRRHRRRYRHLRRYRRGRTPRCVASMPGYVATCPNGSPAGYGGRVSEMPKIQTLGELRAAGYTHRSLREELRENLLSALAGGTDPWPGMHGFEHTVIPQLERAII